MTSAGEDSFSALEELRHSFDQTFAAAPVGETAGGESFVAIRVGEDRVAMRITEIAAIEARRLVVPLPAHKPALLGIAGVRGRIVPVYSLSLLFGHREAGGDRHWLVLVGREQTVGFTFSAFEGHLRVHHRDLRLLGEEKEHPYGSQMLADSDTLRLVLSVPQLVAATRTGAAARTPLQE